MTARTRAAQDFIQRGTDFLKLELQTGLTMADLASLDQPGSEQRARTQRHAREAYDTVVRLLPRFEIDEKPERLIQERLSRLRAALQELGEKFA